MSQAALKLVEPAARPAAISPAELARGIAATPMDHYVIWTGQPYEGRSGSRCAQALALITEVWTPVPLRELVLRAAALGGDAGLRPDRARDAVRAHQRVYGACYFLVRRTPTGDFLAVADVPVPAHGRRLQAGEVVLARAGARFVDTAA